MNENSKETNDLLRLILLEVKIGNFLQASRIAKDGPGVMENIDELLDIARRQVIRRDENDPNLPRS